MLPMTQRQRMIAHRVGKAVQALARFNNRDREDIKDDHIFQRAVRERHDAFTAAIRAELLAYPLIQVVVWPWLESLRGNGQRDVLRRIRKGLDTKVSRPLTLQLRPTADDTKIIELHRKGYSLRRIASVLPDHKIKLMSHTAVGKRLEKCGSVKGQRPVKRKTIL